MERKGKYLPLWGRYKESFDRLSDSQMGKLTHAMMNYYFDGEEPELPGTLLVFWGLLKQDLDYARDSYEKKVEGGRRGGQRSAQMRKQAKEAREAVEEQEAEASHGKQKEGTLSNLQLPQAITITESKTKTESRTISKTERERETERETASGSAPADAGLSFEEKAYGEFGWVRLTDRQYRSLQARMGEQTLRECIRYIDCSAQSTQNRNRWKDWYLILRRCYESGWHQTRSPVRQGKPPIPKGASGELGEAELEAIRMTLARDFPESPPMEEQAVPDEEGQLFHPET